MTMLRLAAGLTAVWLVGAAAQSSSTGNWISRTDGSQLEFSAWYDGQELTGVFHVFRVRVELAEAEAQPEALTVEVEVLSVDMNDDEVNAELMEPDWFASNTFPVALFSSDDIQRNTDGYLAVGRLKIKGIERTLEVPFNWRSDGDSAALAGKLLLSRRHWDIGAGAWADDARLADDVALRYRVALVPAR